MLLTVKSFTEYMHISSLVEKLIISIHLENISFVCI
jgi:hypothetical protein